MRRDRVAVSLAATLLVAMGGCRLSFDPVAPPVDGSTSLAPDSAVEELPGCLRDVALSTLTTCMLFRDGHVECVGRGVNGELGHGMLTTVTAPVRVNTVDDAVRLVGAAQGFCAIRADATAWCWGNKSSDRFGALGPGVTAEPVQIPGVTGVIDIDSGTNHTCAVTTGGGVSCWGANEARQLGDGTTTASATPVPVSLPAPAIRVMVGWSASCALLDDGRVFCWGANGAGSWGTPTQPGAVDGVVEVDAHALSILLRRDDGSLWAFGRNDTGQLGDTGPARNVPMPISALGATVVSAASGDDHGCAVLDGGEARCWGANTVAQLGTVGAPASTAPVTVPGVPPLVVVRAGQMHSCGIATDGNVYCWGDNCCYESGGIQSDVGTDAQKLAVTCP